MASTERDPGLYGPDSITWRIHADPILWLGGLRTLFFQALHPLAMAGVAEHSEFRADPWGRLMRTGQYVGVVSFGTTPDAERAAARVRGIHRKLAGIEPESGTPYRVDDPELLRWVHCTEVDSFLSVFRRSGGSLSDAEADRYVAEQTIAARLVGLNSQSVPASTQELADYFTTVRPRLRATTQAREAARFVLAPPMPTWVAWATPARPAWAAFAGLALALLPRWARRLYQLPGLPPTDLAASLSARALRSALLAIPASRREGPNVTAAKARLAQ